MLPHGSRLRASEVREVLKRGRGRRGTLLSVKYLSTPLPLRCAVVVPKSVAKKAVARNKVRRVIYRILSEGKKDSKFFSNQGSAVFFVHKLPSPPLQRAFTEDLYTLCSKPIS